MTLSHLFEHIEPLEKSGRVAQAVGIVDASLVMQSARLGQAVQHGVPHES
ncbi:hypothetical protein [Candidatus Nitrospira nitrosa]|mgnify:CR=1 FL=1|nr:hypothetical protein [Candidatus Nitrospira nitrosa]